MSEQRDILDRLQDFLFVSATSIEAATEIRNLRADREKCHDIMESQSHQLARMARDIEMFREMIAEMRERNNKLLHKLQEFEAREAQ